MQIAVVNWKGGCGKSTIALAIKECLETFDYAVDLVEHDLQRMTGRASDLGGRHKTTEWEKADGDFVIHDLPPYNTDYLLSILRGSNKIVIPLKVSDNDKLCTVDLIDYLITNNLVDRACLVLNEVRKPYTLIYKDVKGSLEKNFPDIKIADTELSDLRGAGGFKTILRTPLKGKAKTQILDLTKETGILANNKRTLK